MQGGLVQPAGQTGQYHTMGAGGGPPDATGSPALPAASNGQPVAGAGPGVTVSTDITQMGPVDTMLMGTSWNREDVELVLQTISTLLLLYWAVTEVRA